METGNESVIEKVEQLATPIARGEGLDVYDVEFKRESGWTLRVSLMGASAPVTLDACAKVSRQLSVIMDVDEVIKHKYFLEVSSPGITRSLKKPSHFIKSLGSRVRVVFLNSEGGTGELEGVLSGADSDSFSITDKDGAVSGFAYDGVKKVKLTID